MRNAITLAKADCHGMTQSTIVKARMCFTSRREPDHAPILFRRTHEGCDGAFPKNRQQDGVTVCEAAFAFFFCQKPYDLTRIMILDNLPRIPSRTRKDTSMRIRFPDDFLGILKCK